ncbi:hypothetical protein VTG60DRAFT_1782 [Thermothelomyces hinnuleus]
MLVTAPPEDVGAKVGVRVRAGRRAARCGQAGQVVEDGAGVGAADGELGQADGRDAARRLVVLVQAGQRLDLGRDGRDVRPLACAQPAVNAGAARPRVCDGPARFLGVLALGLGGVYGEVAVMPSRGDRGDLGHEARATVELVHREERRLVDDGSDVGLEP